MRRLLITNLSHMRRSDCNLPLKDYDTILNQPPIVIPQVPIVPPQSPIVPPQAPITPSPHVNKQNLDQSPELQIPCHVSKVFLNKLPQCDTSPRSVDRNCLVSLPSSRC